MKMMYLVQQEPVKSKERIDYMSKTTKAVDPFADIRREVPMKPGHAIRHHKEYIKPLERKKVRETIQEGILEYIKKDDDHVANYM